MVKINIQVLFFNYIVFVFAEDYESDDKLYMLVSQDQHQRTPRLEDFFWTGSGDGPPPPPDAPLPAPVQPSTPVVRTTTVLATVYLDSYPPQAVTDRSTGECILNCGEPGVPGSLEPEIPDDRRYWLLTVIQGSTPDSLQMRLARLYQKAFLRQQERHLGIIKSLDAPPARKKHDVHSFVVNKDNNNSPVGPQSINTPFKYIEIASSMVSPVETNPTVLENKVENSTKNDQDSSSDFVYPVNIEMFSVDTNTVSLNAKIKATKLNEVESWILATPTVVIRKREVTDREQLEEIREDSIDIPLESESNETMLFKREILKPDQQPPVQVHIQNITESPETGSIQIVYVVLVGGRAVPAAVAARDMRLVRDAEVARELGAVVTTKAEPYLKTAEGLEGEAGSGVHGTELWALAVGATVAILLLLVLLALLCIAHRKKAKKSAASIRAYRNELLREAERNQLKQVHEEKDGRLISVVSPSRTRPSSSLLPIYRAASAASSSSTTSSGVSEVATAFRRRQKKPHALRMPQKKRVGTTDSLLEAAGLDSSDSGQPSAPPTPTSYLSMPSVNAFPRGNVVEPLSRILEPVSVRHLDIDSPPSTPKKSKPDPKAKDVVPRRQMASQLVRLGSIDKDPGVIGPLVWDLHCQRIKDASKPPSPACSTASARKEPGPSRMRPRFNELMDDAFTLFGSVNSSPNSHDTYTVEKRDSKEKDVKDKKQDSTEQAGLAQARNDNVRLPGSPYTAMDTLRGRSAGPGPAASTSTPVQQGEGGRPRTSFTRTAAERRVPPPARAWGHTPPQSLGARPTVNPALITTEGRLPAEDPAIPLISAIKTEIQRIKETATKPNN
ncbi:hypothetical protein PYW07_006403 [Mythimna separata]|uniref:Uncharacterized protein n=1 Tax=Mythimna separata TaxID=271217 RepID=A0AAD7YW86_MYTSE|nr:hypothetical protein PYW07_006403 [Mythimna separata]